MFPKGSPNKEQVSSFGLLPNPSQKQNENIGTPTGGITFGGINPQKQQDKSNPMVGFGKKQQPKFNPALGERSSGSIPQSGRVQNANKAQAGTLRQGGLTKTYNLYKENYNPRSKYDIENKYHQLREAPQTVDAQQIKILSDQLAKLIKCKAQPLREYNISKIDIKEIAQLQQPQLSQVKNFWLSTIIYFLRDHPYCSFEGILSLLQFHIKQNYDTYYPNGAFNIKLFQQNNLLSQPINDSSPLFLSIQKQLERMLTVFVNQFCALIAITPKKQSDKLLRKQIIAQNMWNTFKQLFNIDNVFSHENNVHQRIGLDLLNCLLALYHKQACIFGKKLTLNIMAFLDHMHLAIIYRGLQRRNSLESEDKTPSSILSRKCIQFLNVLLLKFPYQLDKWDQELKKMIKVCKSELIYPFKWLVLDRKPERMREYAFDRFEEEENQGQTRNIYYLILGSEWFLLLKGLIKNFKQIPILKVNEGYKNVIFYLMCSIIEENPVAFWTNSQEYELVYHFISELYDDIQRNDISNANYVYSLGKICRIMICACGKLSLNSANNEISSELLTSFKQDTIMLRIISSETFSSSQSLLTNLVYNCFISNILSRDHRITKQKFFGEILMRFLVEPSQQQFILYLDLENISPIESKYNYGVPTVIYDLFIRLMTDNTELTFTFMKLWNRENEEYNMQYGQVKQTSQMEDMISFLWKFTFEYIIKVEQQCSARIGQPNSRNNLQANLEQFQILPQIFTLLTKILQNPKSRQIGLALLNDKLVTNNKLLRQTLQNCIPYQCNILAYTNHVQNLYELDLNSLIWVSQILVPIIQNSLESWEIEIIRHYANIVRITLEKSYLNPSNLPKDQQYRIGTSNILNYNLNIQNELSLFNAGFNGSEIISDRKIPELSKYSELLLEFLMWALKVQEDGLRKYNFYNTLYINKKFQILEAALRLLQVLIVLNLKYPEQIYINEKLRRFISVYGTINQLSLSNQSSLNKMRSIGIVPQIELSNKKTATLPAVLAYLISSPQMLSNLEFKQHDSPKAKEVRSIAINILNMILVGSCNSLAFLTSITQNTENKGQLEQVSREDPIDNINFNIYQQYYVSNGQTSYCNAKQTLIQFINKQICEGELSMELSPLKWYQSSYMYGQYVDITTQMNRLFFSSTVHKAIIERITPQLRNNEKLTQQMRRALAKFSEKSTLNSKFGSEFKRQFARYLCDRQILGYSRFILQLSVCYGSSLPIIKQNKSRIDKNISQIKIQDMIETILELIINRLITLIAQEAQTPIKINIVETVSINIWKTMRILQTKKNLQLFTAVIHKYMRFILNYYHLNITNPQYMKNYLISIRLILACKEYLPKNMYYQVIDSNKMKEMLLELMRRSSQKPQFYTVLFYCLNIYAEIMKDDNSSEFKNQLEQVYQNVNQTINPLIDRSLRMSSIKNSQISRNKNVTQAQRRQLSDLNKDATVIILMMFFKLYIPEAMKKSLYDLLLGATSSNLDSAVNFKSLLLNMEICPTNQTIKTALQIGFRAKHYIEYVSVSNHLYTTLTIKENYVFNSQFNIVHNILKFVENVLDKQLSNDPNNFEESWRNLCYMKSWVYNLLYIMLGYSHSKSLTIRIAQIMFNRNHCLSLLGELLSYYGEYQITWPYFDRRSLSTGGLGLLQKELLLSLLKVYMSLISKSDDWNQINKINFSNKNIDKFNAFINFCRSLVYSSKILNKSKGVSGISNPESADRFTSKSTKIAKTQYEHNLIKLPLQWLYRQNSLDSQMKNANFYNKSLNQSPVLEQSRIRSLHPQLSNVLDIVHEYYDLLITEKYLMALLGCYSNPELILESYQFNTILAIFESISKRLVQIRLNENSFQLAMNKIDSQVWQSFGMNLNLYYLNTIQQSPKDIIDLLNSIAQICVNCIVVLKQTMEMHQDFREFYTKADKLLRQAKKAADNYRFDIKAYIDQGGFDNKSQYGASFMVSPSTFRINR